MIVLGGSGCIMFSIVIRCVKVCVFFLKDWSWEKVKGGESKGNTV